MLDVESAKTCEAQDDRCWMLSLLRLDPLPWKGFDIGVGGDHDYISVLVMGILYLLWY